jgi:hypothetical protein
VAGQVMVTDRDLERALRELGEHVAWPSTRDLSASVRVQLAQQGAAPRRSRWSRLGWFPRLSRSPLAAALATVLAAAALLLALSPEARAVVAERLGLPGVGITHVPAVPPNLGSSLNLGERVTLDEARRRSAFSLLVPGLDQPDAVYIGRGDMVSMVYAERPGLPADARTGVALLFTQVRGTVQHDAFGKGLGPDTRLEELTVNGGRGFWISGAPHMFFYRDSQGTIRDELVRLAGNTLVWEQSGLTLRLEGARDREEALRIAAGVR